MLTAISPIDGRYASQTEILSHFFSEKALIHYRIQVEVKYLMMLGSLNLSSLEGISSEQLTALERWSENLPDDVAQMVKEIEKTTNHDVKAVEYVVKEKLSELGLEKYLEMVHFGLTSQDINNTAFPMMIRDALQNVYIPHLEQIIQELGELAYEWKDIPMLARTHGQPASPTLLGKEFMVFAERLEKQKQALQSIPHEGKFGGATGNLNAHYATFPEQDWRKIANDFLRHDLQLNRQQTTTQIEHYDTLAARCQAMVRIHTILIDFCRDVWTYISMDYFKQKTKENEVGSSAMPHKVNPIDFENAEGNLAMANAILSFLAEKLPVSRLQRDLTDSTVLRNIGIPFAHSLIAFKSVLKGLSKLLLNEKALQQDLDDNWAVITEAIQSILRREGVEKPYEQLKNLTRGKSKVTQQDLMAFILQLPVSEEVREELRQLSPHTYTGK